MANNNDNDNNSTTSSTTNNNLIGSLQMQQDNTFVYDQSSNNNLNGITVNSSPHQHVENHTSLHHNIDIKQYEDMSKEELIARLVALEKEKQQQVNKDISSDVIIEEEEEDDDNTLTTPPTEQVRTCLWTGCGDNFDTLQKLISHITEAHVGGGKVK